MDAPDLLPLLDALLSDGRRIGAVGPGPWREHLEQAVGYLAPGALAPGAFCIDLGSGGGLPALPLALVRPDTRWVLVEAWARRADLLRAGVARLGLDDRVDVVARRAEEVGRSALRGTADLVTARGFGPAAVTLECAAPLLRPGGKACVSVRQDEPAWPAAVLRTLGLGGLVEWRIGRFAYRAVWLQQPSPERFPRRPGIPERRPLF